MMVCRGTDFRPQYRKVASLRSLFTTTPLLGLSATVTPTVVDDILRILELKRQEVVIKAYPPDRPNIFLEIVTNSSESIEKELDWITVGVGEERQQFAKTVIFARTINSVADIYTTLMYRLGRKAYINDIPDVSGRMISMYHAHISQHLQKYTLEEFSKSESRIRVLVATVAFGMGIEIPDIRRVVHWGATSSVLTFWQEFGRAGRDGYPATGTWYARGKSDADKDTFKNVRANNSCVRKTILDVFILPETDTSSLERLADRQPCDAACEACNCAMCTCCSYCRHCCPCSSN